MRNDDDDGYAHSHTTWGTQDQKQNKKKTRKKTPSRIVSLQYFATVIYTIYTIFTSDFIYTYIP